MPMSPTKAARSPLVTLRSAPPIALVEHGHEPSECSKQSHGRTAVSSPSCLWCSQAGSLKRCNDRRLCDCDSHALCSQPCVDCCHQCGWCKRGCFDRSACVGRWQNNLELDLDTTRCRKVSS